MYQATGCQNNTDAGAITLFAEYFQSNHLKNSPTFWVKVKQLILCWVYIIDHMRQIQSTRYMGEILCDMSHVTKPISHKLKIPHKQQLVKNCGYPDKGKRIPLGFFGHFIVKSLLIHSCKSTFSHSWFVLTTYMQLKSDIHTALNVPNFHNFSTQIFFNIDRHVFLEDSETLIRLCLSQRRLCALVGICCQPFKFLDFPPVFVMGLIHRVTLWGWKREVHYSPAVESVGLSPDSGLRGPVTLVNSLVLALRAGRPSGQSQQCR